MPHCEYTTSINCAPNGWDYGGELGYCINPLPPPQTNLISYRPTMLAALQAGPIVITHVHLRMYPKPNQQLRPAYGSGMSANIDKNLGWYLAGGNVNNQVLPMIDDNSADLGTLIYDPQRAEMEKYIDWSGCPPVLTINDGLVLSAVNHGFNNPAAIGEFVAIWDFDYVLLAEWQALGRPFSL